MPENDALLRLCLQRPKRLAVYADWLKGAGDAREAYVRGQLALRGAGPAQRPALLAQLRALYPAEATAWCGQFENVGAFEANLLGIDEAWWGVGLGQRGTSATYEAFSYANQPALPMERFAGTFDWLAASREWVKGRPAETGWREKIAALRSRGLRVPSAFERLMLSEELKARVPSCTDNFFISGEDAEEHPLPDGATFLTFYSDSQSCVIWGLRLAEADHYAPVLAGAPQPPDRDPPKGRPSFVFPTLSFCAPSLEAFLYRWWLENSIWFATEFDQTRRALTADEAQYLERLSSASKREQA
jgi:uncharacterized protein (TIGR02996 family)